MTLQLTAGQLQQMATHAEHAYPEECCGLLIGRIDRTSSAADQAAIKAEKTLLQVWQVANAWSSEVAAELDAVIPSAEQQRLRLDTTDRYWIDPKDLLKAQRYARDHQLDIIGIYHSHPDHAAVPSECDRSLAWAQYSYIIISVHHGKAQATECWSLDEEQQFQPEAIVTL